MGYERQLAAEPAAEHFLKNCIPSDVEFKDSTGRVLSLKQVIKKIRDAQLLFDHGENEATMWDRSQRTSEYSSHKKREELRALIVAELIQKERLDNDEEIELGTGGGRPKNPVRSDRVAVLLTGLPASGKSSVVAKVAEHIGAYVVDPDYAKRKFPEFDGTTMGASLVHAESMAVTLGKEYEGINLWQALVDGGINLIRPMVGDEQSKVDLIRDDLIALGYKVHLTTIELDREYASERALHRFLKTDRYVSLSYIFDDCANDSSLVYYRARIDATRKDKSAWTSVGIISTAGAVPRYVDSWGKDNPAELFREAE